jgi:hypothetical protein
VGNFRTRSGFEKALPGLRLVHQRIEVLPDDNRAVAHPREFAILGYPVISNPNRIGGFPPDLKKSIVC